MNFTNMLGISQQGVIYLNESGHFLGKSVATIEEMYYHIADFNNLVDVKGLEKSPTVSGFWACFWGKADSLEFVSGYNTSKEDLQKEKQEYCLYVKSNLSTLQIPILCQASCPTDPKPFICQVVMQPKATSPNPLVGNQSIRIAISLFSNGNPYTISDQPVFFQIVAWGSPNSP